jgi:dihydroorotate dehydrogenase (NAD+) catalytic subunit
MLNAVGLQNPGVDAFIEEDLPWLLTKDVAVIANIAGACEDDYCAMAEKLAPTGVHMLEMNISCPNVKEGGVAFGTNAKTIHEITSEVKKHSTKPVIVKLSPNVTDITEMARAAEAGGANALSLINTLLGMRIDIKTKRPILHNNVGGLSGPAVFPVAVRMIWQVRNAVSLPLLGMGGISNGVDAIEFMLAGATAVAVGTATFTSPATAADVTDGIAAYCEKNGFASVTELTGALAE